MNFTFGPETLPRLSKPTQEPRDSSGNQKRASIKDWSSLPECSLHAQALRVHRVYDTRWAFGLAAQTQSWGVGKNLRPPRGNADYSGALFRLSAKPARRDHVAGGFSPRGDAAARPPLTQGRSRRRRRRRRYDRVRSTEERSAFLTSETTYLPELPLAPRCRKVESPADSSWLLSLPGSSPLCACS